MKFLKSFFIRYLKYFIIGLAVLVLIEVGGMIYVNNIYLADNSAYSVVKVTKAPAVTFKYKSVNIGTGAQQEAGSFDGRYVACLRAGSVSITDLTSGDTTTVGGVSGMTADHFKWLYDRNWLAIAEKSVNSAGSPYVKLYSYDITNKTLTEIRNNNANQDLKIQLSSRNDSVTQIEMSAETGVNYVKVSDKSGTSKLWKINSFVGVQQMGSTITVNIGKIVCLKTADDLLYEDSGNGRVYQYSTGSSLKINGNRSLKILGIDSSDNVYLAAMNNGTTDTVYYGSPSDNNWNAVSLGKAVGPINIFVTISGGIYINDSVKSSILKVPVGERSIPQRSSSNSGSSSSAGQPGMSTYKGSLLDVFQNGFVSIENGYTVHNEF